MFYKECKEIFIDKNEDEYYLKLLHLIKILNRKR